MEQTNIIEQKHSLTRPAWTQDDLHAFNHKHVQSRMIGGVKTPSVLKDYYLKSRGIL